MGLHGVFTVIGLESLSGEPLTRIADVEGLVQGIQPAALLPLWASKQAVRGRLEVDRLGGSGGSELLWVMAISSDSRPPMAEASRVPATARVIAGSAASP